ncbi:MAG: ribosomal protein S18-alanine N-acetyltransferase [Actinomycetota bacterium]|nr:ribosomal protein S18-alanine N-acetyltransferase [Actinomycetota bacterium]
MSAVSRAPEEGSVPELELTKMRRRHLRRVLAIEAQVYPRPWSASLFLSELAQRSTRSYLVAKNGGEVVGYAGMMFMGEEAHVTNIAVDPALQSRKVGTRLLLAITTEAIARGAGMISLEVRMSNRVAQAMYEKFGFSAAGIRKGYYVETNEDALIMNVENARSTDYRIRLQGIREELDRWQALGE